MHHFNPEMLNRPRKKNNPETHLVRQIIIYLKSKQYAAGKIKVMGVKRGNSFCLDPLLWRGCPDILAFVPKLIFIEAKILPNKIKDGSPQADFRDFCKKANIPHYEINNLEQTQKLFP